MTIRPPHTIPLDEPTLMVVPWHDPVVDSIGHDVRIGDHSVISPLVALSGNVVTGAEDPMTLSIVAAWCAQHGVRTQDLHVGRRSLEDVVVELVGDL